MQLLCTGKTPEKTPCGSMIDRPDHKRGGLEVFCQQCHKTTWHCPQPDKPPGTWLPRKPFGHAVKVRRGV